MSAGPVSVVVPVRDGARFLGAALASLRGDAIAEIVVVDDGSSDATPRIARADPRVVYLRQEPAGVAAARNRGVAAARAPLVGFVDADDLWSVATDEDPRLARLAAEPGLDGVFARARLFRDRSDGERELGAVFATFQLGAALFRRELFARAGGFDPALTGGEDLEWYLRALDQGARFATLEEATLLYRRHDANMTFDTGRTRGFLLAALGRTIRRRRSA